MLALRLVAAFSPDTSGVQVVTDVPMVACLFRSFAFGIAPSTVVWEAS
jgi:hypothetical protein